MKNADVWLRLGLSDGGGELLKSGAVNDVEGSRSNEGEGLELEDRLRQGVRPGGRGWVRPCDWSDKRRGCLSRGFLVLPIRRALT